MMKGLRGKKGSSAKPGKAPKVSPVELIIEKAVDAPDEDWESIVELCDLILEDKSEAVSTEALSVLKKYIKSSNPNNALKGILILEACVKNCDYRFHSHLATKDWMERLMRIIRETKVPDIRSRLLQLLADWREEFRTEPGLAWFSKACTQLTAKGVKIPNPREPALRKPDPSIFASLRRSTRRMNRETSRPALPDEWKQDKPEDTSSQKQNRGVSNLNNIIPELDDLYGSMEALSEALDNNWGQSRAVVPANSCRTWLRRIQALLSSDASEDMIVELLEVNYELLRLLEAWDLVDQSDGPLYQDAEEMGLEDPYGDDLELEDEMEDELVPREVANLDFKEKFEKEREKVKRLKEDAKKLQNDVTRETIRQTTHMADVTRDVKGLESDLKRTRALGAQATQELDDLRRERDELFKAHNEDEHTIRKLRLETDKFAREVNDMERDRERLETQLEKFKSTSGEGGVSTTFVQETQSELDRLRNELSTMRLQQKENVSAEQASAAELTELRHLLDEEREKVQKLKSSEQNWKSQFEIAEKGKGELQQQLSHIRADAEKATKDKQAAVKGSSQEITHWKAQAQMFESEGKELQRQLEELRSGSSSQEKRLSEIQAANTVLGRERENLQEQLALLQETSEREITTRDGQIDEFKLQLGEAQGQVVTLKNALAAASEDNRASVLRLNARTKNLQTMLTSVNTDIRTRQRDFQDTLADLGEQLRNTMVDWGKQLGTVSKERDELIKKYREEMRQRKRLFNKIQELKGKIRVYCRVRPLIDLEKARNCKIVTTFPEEGEICVTNPSNERRSLFEFDRVFPPEMQQDVVYESVEGIAISVLDGYNVCIFAYGQTGSGKTHTMEGPANNPGINARTLTDLFRVIDERREDYAYEVDISVLEIYNEVIRDLLAEQEEKLEIRHEKSGIVVPNLSIISVKSIKEILRLCDKAARTRATGVTNLNEHSSRSHQITSIYVTGHNKVANWKAVGKLHLIDLAGSERVAKSEARGDRLKEAQYINKSLSALGDVISSLSAKESHIPFRNSKLTHFLQDSLGGNSKTLMFVNTSPADYNVLETLCSLTFACHARTVELGPARRNVEREGGAAARKDTRVVTGGLKQRE